jgi:methylase of polypeptide subunit release factors
MTKTQDDALLTLIELLRDRDYQFVTPTPATHARVIARSGRGEAHSLIDMLGWSLPFRPGSVDPAVEHVLEQAGMLREEDDGRWRSQIRVSSLYGCLFCHSAFPTEDSDAVFFGPDSYRFADLIVSELSDCQLGAGQLIADIGTGAGVGAIIASRMCPEAAVAMTDINPQALHFAGINAAAAGVEPFGLLTDRLEGLDGAIDLAIANPPYLSDDQERLYRHGGGLRGGQVTCDMVEFILPRLAVEGRLILYSGSAIVNGADRLRETLNRLAEVNGFKLRYREIDPDVFGEELEKPAYRDVDRIAVIAALFERG